MEGKKKRGRPRMMLLDWMMKAGITASWRKELDIVVNGAIGRTTCLGRQRTKKKKKT